MLATRNAWFRSRLVYLLALASLLGSHALAANNPNRTAQRAIESSVVKISVHSNPPNLLFPWQKAGTQSASGSGVIIDGKRILTCAHVTEDAVSVEVKRAGMSEPFVADVAFDGVTAESVADLTFSTEPVDAPFSATDTVVVRTATGAVFKLGNASESDTGVTFNYAAL